MRESAKLMLWRPWRSVCLGTLVTITALIAGVPVFLRMPPWCDLTLYDVAASNLLHGGIHYRDVFDTNMPGFVWLLAALRATLGWSIEAVRTVDLIIVAAMVWMLRRLARGGGADRAACVWAIAGVAAFYPFSTEFNHCQRDCWMLLPALVAVLNRSRRIVNERQSFAAGVIEGVLWGVAVWIKPHAVVPAAVVWCATAAWLPGGRRGIFRDLLANVLGGFLIGTLGISWLIASGTWPHFVEVFTVWNTQYAATMWAELPSRSLREFGYFPPWSLLHLIAVPIALWSLLEGHVKSLPSWLWLKAASERERYFRIALSSLYLGWLGQALLMQREFHYVHLPETFMAFFVVATQRWAVSFAMIVFVMVTSLAVRLGVEPANTTGLGPDRGDRWAILHPAFEPERPRLWLDCWLMGLSNEEDRSRRSRAGLVHGFHAANDWVQLGEVADWLAMQRVKDGEVLAWHDAPHAVYLELHIQPAFRFQHVSHIAGLSDDAFSRVNAELCTASPHIRFVVSDLMRCGADAPERVGDMASCGPDGLPSTMPSSVKAEFPYQLPVVFRSGSGHGRYVVHAMIHPLPQCMGP